MAAKNNYIAPCYIRKFMYGTIIFILFLIKILNIIGKIS